MYLSDLDGSLILLTLLFIQWEPFSERQVQNYRRELVRREGNIGLIPTGRSWCRFLMFILCVNTCTMEVRVLWEGMQPWAAGRKIEKVWQPRISIILDCNSSLSHYSTQLCQKIKSFSFEAKNPHFIFFIVYGCPANRHLVSNVFDTLASVLHFPSLP